MDYAKIDDMINTLYEEMREETIHAAFLTNGYFIATNEFINLGPVEDEEIARAVPHTVKAAQVAKKLEKVCRQYQLKYGNTDPIDSILSEIGATYDARKEAQRWFFNYKPKTKPI